MVDIFTALLAIVSTFALIRAIIKIILSPPKVWEEEEWTAEKLEAFVNWDELRKENPHIWMN